jgi:flagellar FliL protein
MASKKKKDTDGEAPKKGKSKMIVVGVFLAIAAFGAKTMLMKPQSAADAAAAKVAAQQKLVALCDRQNGITPPKTAAGVADAVDPATERGQVLEMDPLTVNLSDGHYLKVGVALQLNLGAVAATDKDNGTGARALDMAIAALSPHTMAQLTQSNVRDGLKQKLGYDTCMAYQGTALTVYFTDFVMQ